METAQTLRRLAKGLGASLTRHPVIWLAMLAGLVLLSLPSGERGGTPGAETAERTASFDLTEIETRLAETLSRIQGAGEVTVMLTVRDGPRQVLAQDTQREDLSGGVRSETVVLARGSGSQETVTVQEVYPGFQGALLVCEGGDDPQVRLKLTRAVSALTGLGSDRISICKGK